MTHIVPQGMTVSWGKASRFRGQEEVLRPTQPLLGQESFKEKVLLQPGVGGALPICSLAN